MFGVVIVILAWLELSLIIVFTILSDSFTHSHTLDIMADLEGNHGDENNLNNENFHAHLPIRTLRDYLQPTRSSAPSCIIFPTNANNLDRKSVV